MAEWARTLRKLHDATAFRAAIRGEREQAYFEAKLSHKIGFAEHPVLDRLVAELSSSPLPRQLILGDPSPKNVGVRHHLSPEPFIVFFDLEDSHDGYAAYDFGSVVGHTILHNSFDAAKAHEQAELVVREYGPSSAPFFDAVKRIALGTILYRLQSIVPYAIPFGHAEKDSLASAIRRLLHEPAIEDLSWKTVVTSILEA